MAEAATAQLPSPHEPPLSGGTTDAPTATDTAPAPAPADAIAEPEPQWTDPNYQPPEGHVGNLTPAQQDALTRFRALLQDEGIFVEKRMDEAFLLRYLRARKWDVAAARLMLADAEQWRKENDVDNIINFDFPEKEAVSKYYPKFYHKTDKDGRPIYIEDLSKLNPTELRKITTTDRQLKALMKEYEKFTNERLPASSKSIGHPVETCTTILDLKNAGVRTFYEVSDYVQRAAKIGQNYYPETMGKFYIINSPMMFSVVWSIVKPWLDPVTVEKIKIPSKSETTKVLLEQIPAENLPVELGGKCKCPGGCSLSDAGPWNAQSQ